MLVQRADKIVAISAHTKKDLITTYHISPKKIDVIHNGIAHDQELLTRNSPEVLATKEKYHLPYKFILSFATIEPRKNIKAILLAYNALRKQRKDLTVALVIAGSSGWCSQSIKRAIETSPFKEDIFVIKDVSEKHKQSLYVLADLFIYPSLYEGFGFPPLEALQTNTPIITSHNSSLPEIITTHGILIDPQRPEELLLSMQELLTQRTTRQECLSGASKHVKRFSWARAADHMAKLLSA